MSYHKYTTDAIVLKRTPYGEGNILLYILTKDFGLILASAQSLRHTHSKLRASLQEFGFAVISLVKGKNSWKVTNASAKENIFFELSGAHRELLARVIFVLLKTIVGELTHPEIFEVTKSGFEFLRTAEEKEIKNIEIILVLRILYSLGYVAMSSNTGIFLSDIMVWNSELLEKAEENRDKLVAVINHALKESQL